jgi:hypothetical protein
LQEASPTVFADLGYGVLDSAMVEVAAFCLEHAVEQDWISADMHRYTVDHIRANFRKANKDSRITTEPESSPPAPNWQECACGHRQRQNYLTSRDDLPKFVKYRFGSFPKMFPNGYPPNTLLFRRSLAPQGVPVGDAGNRRAVEQQAAGPVNRAGPA